MNIHNASCSCGQLKLTCKGDPVRVSMCHCIECQKRTGSVFGVQGRFERNKVEITGTSKGFTRMGDSGGKLTFHFCPECGSTIYWEIDALKDFLSVAVGNFSNSNFPAPTVSVYELRRHSWTVMPTLNVEVID